MVSAFSVLSEHCFQLQQWFSDKFRSEPIVMIVNILHDSDFHVIAASRNAVTTRSCCASVNEGYIGKLIVSV